YWRSYAAEEYSQYGVPLRFSDADDMMSYFNEVLDQFYKYGSSVVEMILLRLENNFGKDRYDFLRAWFDSYKHRTATTEDLREFLIGYTGDYSFWEEFFNEWVYSVPCPTLRIYDYAFDGSNLSFRIMKTSGVQKMKNIKIILSTNQGEKITSVDVENLNEPKTVNIKISSAPGYISIDPDYYYVFLLDKSEWNGPVTDFGRKNYSNILPQVRPEILKSVHSRKYKSPLKQ
ncbi:MAG: hypothetical protein N3B13_01200, partial [Deltaproteobacteria bacterium]|nr:hypothetical protein [Deltaproteobacteria bacterium]